MRILSLAVISLVGLADAASIRREAIQHHMNKLDKLRLLKNSHRVVPGRKLEDAGANDGQNYESDYANDDAQNYGSDYANDDAQNDGSDYANDDAQNNGNYQNNGQNNNGGYYTQNVNQYYNTQDDNTQDEEERDFEIDGTYSIKFDKCVSLKTLNSEMINNVEKGLDMQAGVDFVMFKATDKYGKATDFTVNIATFVESLIQTVPNDREQYCQVCEQAFDTCKEQKELKEWNAVVANTGNVGNYYTYNSRHGYDGMQDWGAADENGSRRRKLDEAQYGTDDAQYNSEAEEDEFEYIDCETCDSYGCFDDLYKQQTSANQDDDQQDDLYSQQQYYNNNNDEDSEISMQAALNWITELGECKKLNVYTNQNANYAQYQNSGQSTYYKNQMQNPYASLMCNSDGSGMEIGIFHDEECTVYDSTRTFKDMLKSGSPQESYYKMTKGLMEFTFTQPIECKQIEYAEPDWDARYEYDNQEGDANEQNYEAYYQAQNGYYQDQTDAYYTYYQEGSDEEATESCQQLFSADFLQLGVGCNVEQAQQNYQNANYQPYRYQSYYYDVTDATDMDQVCTAMKLKMDKGGFETMMTQSRFKNMYNYKLYSATVTWNDYKTKISEGAQTFKHQAGEKFQQINGRINETPIETLAILAFNIVGSILLVYLIYKISGKISERLEHHEGNEEARTEGLAKEMESYEFFDEVQNEPSGKRLRIDYPPYNSA